MKTDQIDLDASTPEELTVHLYTTFYGVTSLTKSEERKARSIIQAGVNMDAQLISNTRRKISTYASINSRENIDIVQYFVKIGNIEMLKVFMKNGLDVKKKRHNGTTLLYSAIANEAYVPQLEMLKFLINNGVDVNSKDNDGSSILERYEVDVAINTRTVELLLQSGFDPNTMYLGIDSTLLHLITWESFNILNQIVDLFLKYGFDIYRKNINGDTIWDRMNVDQRNNLPQLNPNA